MLEIKVDTKSKSIEMTGAESLMDTVDAINAIMLKGFADQLEMEPNLQTRRLAVAQLITHQKMAAEVLIKITEGHSREEAVYMFAIGEIRKMEEALKKMLAGEDIKNEQLDKITMNLTEDEQNELTAMALENMANKFKQ